MSFKPGLTVDLEVKEADERNESGEESRESVATRGEVEEAPALDHVKLEHQKNSLAGYLGHVSTEISRVKHCMDNSVEFDELETALIRLKFAWRKYENSYQDYVKNELSAAERERVGGKYFQAQVEYRICGMKLEQKVKDLSVARSEKKKSASGKSRGSSRQSKLREMKKNAEVQKLLLEHEQDLALMELELERQRLELDFARKRREREIRLKMKVAEKEAEFQMDGGSEISSVCDLETKECVKLLPPMSTEQKVQRWNVMSDVKLPKIEPPENAKLFSPDPPAVINPNPTEQPKLTDMKMRPGQPSTPRDTKVSYDPQTVMLKVSMLQAMQPVKFSGDPSDFPTFRERIRDNLEDGVLTDSQRVEFLPKFLSGSAYEVLQRLSGCPYDVVVATLEERYGKPATVAAACINNLTRGSKLGNNDYVGLSNFGEQLEAAAKTLKRGYETEVNSMNTLKQIVSRLPGYLINKWGDASYAIREKGGSPELKDLASFVKRQAAIKNDPGFVSTQQNTPDSATPYKSRVPQSIRPLPKFQNKKQFSAFMTDPKPEGNSAEQCLCCSGAHKLVDCEKFSKLELQRRWDLVKEHRLCHVCLIPGHRRWKCSSTEFCGCRAEKRHHKLLHNESRKKRETQRTGAEHQVEQNNPKVEDQMKTEQYATTTSRKRKAVLLHVVPVRITSFNDKTVTTYGMLDNGSRATMISHDIAERLGMKGRKENIAVNTLLRRENEEFEIVEFSLQSATGTGEVISVQDALVSRRFNIDEKLLPRDVDRRAHPHLMDIELPDVEVPKVSVLIGKDVNVAHEILEVRKPGSTESKLQGQRGPLGWVITGIVEDEAPGGRELSVNFTDTQDRKLREQLERFWEIDGFGTRTSEMKAVSSADSYGPSREDIRAGEILEKTTKLVDGHYETGLLWRDDNVRLPNNRKNAEKRLDSLKKKFDRDPAFKEMYCATMEDYIAKGYARKLSPEEASQTRERTFYLAHFGVTNKNKPGRVRIVFDAAAETDGTSLNKNLLQGPDRANNLFGVLLRFRQQPIALVADIESMFFQVRLRKEDQDSQRILWWSDEDHQQVVEYVMTVHIFGATDSPCVANSCLRRTAEDNRDNFHEEVVESVLKNFYVDDLLKSLSTPEIASDFATEIMALCARGGFKLTKFLSNDREVLASIPSERRAQSFVDLELERLPVERALGVKWDVERDQFGFKIMDLPKPDSMRGVLSTISSVFDPLGLAAPVMLNAKQIMQELWRKKLHWDEPLKGPLLQRWNCWKSNLLHLSKVTVPRCFFSTQKPEGSTLQLHHFCDASEVGYGAVSYLRVAYLGGQVECAFIMGKSRNAPLKSITIPRLELQGAVLAVRMYSAIERELELEVGKVVFWTDSMITLNYIRNETRRFQTYVANRVTEIRERTSPEQWRHCPGSLNPADDASRGLTIKNFLSNRQWLNGPEFLTEEEENWPEENFEEVPDDVLEIRKEVYLTTTYEKTPLNELLKRYSSWMKLLRVCAWLLKFSRWIITRRNKKDAEPVLMEKNVTTDEIELAKRRVVLMVQQEAFPEELRSGKGEKGVKRSSPLACLKPLVKEDGVLRVGGRISRAPVSLDAMNPMILPKEHHVTTILIRYIHEKNGHCGHEQVLSILREQFWVVHARLAIKQILTKCVICRKRSAPPLSQQMSELPKARLTPYEQPFTFTGVDYFGPLYVKRGRGRVAEKRYGAIFVCMNSRAIHLEVARSLETDDFIMVLVRFLNRRGQVKEIWSDNGSNFVGADRELREISERLDHDRIQNKLSEVGCKWRFQTPAASHMSGVWERLVRIVKRTLKSVVGQDLMDEEVLNTVFTEAERIANTRPLTRNPAGPDDEEPLTPSHFLNIRPSMNIPVEEPDERDMYRKKKWRQAQLLAHHCWKRWLKEYIPSLQERRKWCLPTRNLQVGDLVLVADDDKRRNKWPLGRIVNTFPGSDGRVRIVEVRVEDNVIRRPVTKICLLEAVNDEA